LPRAGTPYLSEAKARKVVYIAGPFPYKETRSLDERDKAAYGEPLQKERKKSAFDHLAQKTRKERLSPVPDPIKKSPQNNRVGKKRAEK